MNMNSFPFSDELNRRRFVSLAAKSFLGVSILPWASHRSLSGAGLGLNRPLNHAPKAKNVIYLYMSGGMTHLTHSILSRELKLVDPLRQLRRMLMVSNWPRIFPY